MRTHRPRRRTRRLRPLHRLRAHQHGDHRARIQTKRLMSQHAQQRRNLPAVARNADPRTLLIPGKNLIQHRRAAHALRRRRLRRHPVPHLVARRKPGFEAVARERSRDIGARAASVARVDADALAQAVFDGRRERMRARQGEPGERVVRRLQAAPERRGVVALGRGDLLDGERVRPEGVGDECLCDARGVEVCVGPGGGGVAVDFGVVAVPGGRAVEGLGGVVVAFAVAAWWLVWGLWFGGRMKRRTGP